MDTGSGRDWHAAHVPPQGEGAAFGLERLRVRGFRSALDVSFAPGRLCALVGEANAGKSNLLLAIRALLDPAADALRRRRRSRRAATVGSSSTARSPTPAS